MKQTKPLARAISVIIISNAKTDKLKQMTQEAIDSALLGGLPMQIVVVEQQENISYNGADTTYFKQDHFNYNKALNYGASFCVNDYIAFCNNDVLFTDGWAVTLIDKMNFHNCDSGSPSKKIGASAISWRVGVSFAGWCFVWTRKLYEKVGLSEKYSYWCSDNIVALQANKAGYFHVKSGKTVVHHLSNKTGATMDKKEFKNMTWQQAKDFKDNEGVDIFPAKLVEFNLR